MDIKFLNFYIPITQIIFGIFHTVCRWRVFGRAGEKAWTALIPFYSDYVMSDIVYGKPSYFIWVTGCRVLGFLIGSTSFGFLTLVLDLIKLVATLKCEFMLGRVFDKTKVFSFGLAFLTIIYLPLLAFGNDEYIGPKANKQEVYL